MSTGFRKYDVCLVAYCIVISTGDWITHQILYVWYIKKLIRKSPPNGVMLAMNSTEKQTFSFQETTRPQPNPSHWHFDQEAQALTTKPHCLLLLYVCLAISFIIYPSLPPSLTPPSLPTSPSIHPSRVGSSSCYQVKCGIISEVLHFIIVIQILEKL